jgi:hypothetical protein
MWVFIISGALYLIGVAIILVIKPSFMFTPDGNWKEFGIGQNAERYTTFPFWLFCLTWALISYTIVLIILPSRIDDGDYINEDNYTKNRNRNSKYKTVKRNVTENDSDLVFDDDVDEVVGNLKTLPKGYYVLNKKASRLAGVPKYVFMTEE